MRRHGVHDDHVALVVGRELERATVGPPVQGEDAVVRPERDARDAIALQNDLAEIVARVLEQGELERRGDDGSRAAVADRLARLLEKRGAVGARLGRERPDGLAWR